MTVCSPGVCWRKHFGVGATTLSSPRTGPRRGDSEYGQPSPPGRPRLDDAGYTGPELCRLVRDRAWEPYTYILLLTSAERKGRCRRGHGLRCRRLHHQAVRQARAKGPLTGRYDESWTLQEQLVTAREALRIQATRDYLTQLWNRSSILDILQRELARSERERYADRSVVADLDHFKAINDTHGHFAGDTALQETARRMQAFDSRATTRSDDTAAKSS